MPNKKVVKTKKSDKFLAGTAPETVMKVQDAAKLIAKGKTRATVIEHLQDEYGIAYDTARKYYNDAVHYLLPDDDEQYRQELIKVNYERLNTIIQTSMEKGDNRVAREAIAEQNKMCGLRQGMTVGIATDKVNDTQQIVIKFD